MKRSEMIMDLATEVVMYDNQIDYGTAQEIAITLLQKCEELGMLPPQIKNPLVKDDCLISHSCELALDQLYDRKSGRPSKYYVNKWESEDE